MAFLKIQTIKYLVAFMTSFGIASSAYAHEFWLEPRDFSANKGDTLEIDVKIGQDFKSKGMVFVPQRVREMAVHDSNGTKNIESVLGDIPALAPSADNEGLNVVTYHAAAQTFKFRDYAKFLEYVDFHGMKNLATQHIRRKLPMSGFVESYSRAGKTLVKVGTGEGQDSWKGMPLELVALTNPYTDDLSEGMKVQVLWQGKPMPKILMHVYQRNQLTYLASTRTNENGVASIPVNSGGAFMLNSVHMYEPNQNAEHAWESYWASLTYEVKP